jgi:hypothetical protein
MALALAILAAVSSRDQSAARLRRFVVTPMPDTIVRKQSHPCRTRPPPREAPGVLGHATGSTSKHSPLQRGQQQTGKQRLQLVDPQDDDEAFISAWSLL